jgi:hypothetical protein
MTGQKPQLDLSKISFPTDQITIQGLRSLFPHLFDTGGTIHFFRDAKDNLLAPMMQDERDLARRAFDEAAGNAPEDADWELARADLIKNYVAYKVARGPSHGEQLIRSFERQATEQARGCNPQIPHL